MRAFNDRRRAHPPCPPSLREGGNKRNWGLRAQSARNPQFRHSYPFTTWEKE